MSSTNDSPVDLTSIGSFDFMPDWVRKDAGVSVGSVTPERAEKKPDERPARRGGGERKFSDERKGRGGAKPFKRDFAKPRFEERVEPLAADIRILPETKALGTIIKKLQQGFQAYKLKDLAYFFLDNPQSVLIKATLRDDAKFFQCKACSFASMKREDVVAHAISAHLGDYYDVKEVECEPPKGNFTCVAKCGLSGVLLGPPNIHDFNSVVAEMVRTRFPGMSEESYRSHIEMVRESDVIEQWRLGATKKTQYFAKTASGDEASRALTREQAEGEFKRNILPSLIAEPKNLMITADMAAKSPCKALAKAVRDAIETERRSPYNMCYALRGAFHHRKMKFFRANDAKGPEFVTNVELKAFDAEHAIDELKAVSKFIDENPCCDRSEFPADVADFEKYLNWLVNTGHVVSFTNGVFSKVEKYPKYGPQWKKRAKAVAPVTEEVAPVTEEVKNETADQLA